MSTLKQLAWYCYDERFKKCPFCGKGVDVFERPDARCEVNGRSWWIQCKTMECLLGIVGGDVSLDHLMATWNTQYP